MRRFILILVLALVTLLVITAGAALYIIHDEDLLKSQLAGLVQRHTGRELEVAGPLQLSLGRETTLLAGQITLSNAAWAEDPQMVRIGRLEITLNIPSLFGDHRPDIPHVLVDDCEITLLENETGQANWDILPASEPEPGVTPPLSERLPVKLTDLLVTGCSLSLQTPRRARPLQVNAEKIGLQRSEVQHVSVDIQGAVNGDPVAVEGWLDPANAFLIGGPVEHDLDVRYGAISLQSSGTIADAKTLTGADITAYFQGPAIETLLEDFSLPPISHGAFDFRLNMDSRADMTRLDINGDLGSINMTASGALDRLLQPSRGGVSGSLEGGNLNTIGRALGVEGLPETAYALKTTARFEGTVIELQETRLDAGGDWLGVTGTIGARSNLPGTDLEIQLEAADIGLWAPLFEQPVQALGALSLSAKARVDSSGNAAIDAAADFLDSHLKVKGPVGPLAGPWTPDLRVDFDSSNPRPLFALAGRPGFPEAPLKLNSQLKLAAERLYISGLELDLAGQRATVDGFVNLTDHVSGSELTVSLDISNVDELGTLFGKQGLPPQPLKASGELKPQGKGLAFKIEDSTLGDIRLKMNGRIADLDRPLGMDAEFDVRLPSLDILQVVLPGVPLPPGAFSAAGQLNNDRQSTHLKDVELTLGEIRASITGELLHDNRFDLQIAARGPDVSVFNEMTGRSFDPLPFTLQSRLAGSPQVLTFDPLALKVGESDVAGKLHIGLGETTTIAGSLSSEYLDLRNWMADETAVPKAPERPKTDYVFREEPIPRLEDYGVEIDADITIAELDLGNTQLLDIDLGLLLKGRQLRLDPLALRGKGGGQLHGDFLLDQHQGVPLLDVDLHARNLKAGLGSNVGLDTSTWPPGDIDVVLRGSGHTQRELAKTLNGKVRVSYGSGLMSIGTLESLMSDFLTELISTLNPFAETSEYTELECAVGAADFVQGKVKVEPVVFRTKQIMIVSQGAIDLHSENLDLSFNSIPRKGLGLSASTLINPFIKVGGRLNSPVIELDPKSTVVSGGLAVATAGLSILAKSVSDRFLSSKDPCGDALKAIETRDNANP